MGGGWVRKGANGTVQPSMEDWFGVHNCRCDVRFREVPSGCCPLPSIPSPQATTQTPKEWITNPRSCEPFHAPHTPQEKASKKLTIENPRLNSKTKQKSYNTPLQPDGTLQPSKKTTKRTRKAQQCIQDKTRPQPTSRALEYYVTMPLKLFSTPDWMPFFS